MNIIEKQKKHASRRVAENTEKRSGFGGLCPRTENSLGFNALRLIALSEIKLKAVKFPTGTSTANFNGPKTLRLCALERSGRDIVNPF